MLILKEATTRKLKAENDATSARLRMFLVCGKVVPNDNLNFTETKSKQDDCETKRRTPVFPTTPGRLSSIPSMLVVGKRRQDGGLESPSKRARNFKNYTHFGEGGGWRKVMATTQQVKYIHP